ncbi:MAG: hypothetical protein ACR5LD_00420 [Symbiopectobacterium sp.]
MQDSVTQVIEQNMNGIDNLLYMAFNSDFIRYGSDYTDV